MAFIKEEPASPTAVFSHIITEQRTAAEKSSKHLHHRQSNPTSVAPLAIPARIQQIYNEFETSPMMSPPALQFDNVPDTNGTDLWNGINIKRESITRESSVESNTPHSCLTSVVPLAQEPEDFGCSPMFESHEDPSTWSSLFADEDQAIYIKQETDINSMETSTSSLIPSSASQMSLGSSSSSQLLPPSSNASLVSSQQSWSTGDGSALPATTNEALREFLVNSARLQGGMDPLAGLTMLQSLESQSKNNHSSSISSTSSSNSASSTSTNDNTHTKPSSSKSGTEPQTSGSKVSKKTPQEKAQLKRARNTEAARRSRARKTERLSELEGRCAQLSQRNQQLEMEVLRLRLLMARSQELSSEATFKALFDKNF